MDFFDSACQEPPFNFDTFGIRDDIAGEKAYTDTKNKEKWIATVKNKGKVRLTFTSIDKCIIKDSEEVGRGRCDAMLTSENHLYFIELKDDARRWINDAIKQLESTVMFYLQYHDASEYKHKKAFACNKKHKPFQVIDNEMNKRFFRQYGFRIDIQAEIIVV